MRWLEVMWLWVTDTLPSGAASKSGKTNLWFVGTTHVGLVKTR